MADLMRDDISVGEIAAAAEAPFHVLEKSGIEIDLLVFRAIERPIADWAPPQLEAVRPL